MTQWSSLACLQAPLVTPIMAGTHWLAVANPEAGTFQALQVAREVQEQVGEGMSLYKTHENPAKRLREITACVASFRPSLSRPLGVLALGGDKTVSDAVMGVLHYIFPRWADLWETDPEDVADRMFRSGIQVGIVRLGGANDNGGVYGAPKNKTKDILKYMDESQVTSLNLGVAFLGEEQTPHVFCHTLSAGETIAPVYEKTVDERGKAAKRHRERLFFKNVWARKSFQASWTHSNGSGTSAPILEVLIHAVVRADEKMGLPGTPQPGLGVKIFPAQGLWKTARLFNEVLWRGLGSMRGNPKGLFPDDKLSNMPEAFQPQIQVGEELDMEFRDAAGAPFLTAIQSEGDFVVRTNRVRVRGLPPLPRAMTGQNELMANLHNALGEAPSD